MKKVLEIDSCYECPSLSVDAPEEGIDWCKREEKHVDANSGIPDWCPLPDVEE